jgi:hypothetical protein
VVPQKIAWLCRRQIARDVLVHIESDPQTPMPLILVVSATTEFVTGKVTKFSKEFPMKTTITCSPALTTERRFGSLLLAVLLMILAGCDSSTSILGSAAPVTCQQRRSLMGKGTVVIVINSSDRAQSLWLEAGSKRTKFALSAGQQKQFGFLEGYQFGDNSTFNIGGESFASTAFRVKELPEEQ